MPKILALDSSSDACSVALHCDGEIIHVFELAAKSHTQRLLPMVDEVLQRAQCKLTDMDAIAYGRGPGSFTGLRICMGVVQGLAFGVNLPVIPVSTLQAMARAFVVANPNNHLPILVALDARMEEIYWSLLSASAVPQMLLDEQVMKPVLVCEQEAVVALEKNFIAIGAGWHYDDLQKIAPHIIRMDVQPDAKDIVALAVELYKKGETISVLDAQPVYLRNSISWQKRQRIRTVPIITL